MPTYRGTQLSRAPAASGQFGNTWIDSNVATPTAALTTADVVVGLEVPAGIRLETLRYRGGDFDTGTTLTVNVGYRTKLPGGTATALTFFGAALTTLQAATAAWQELVFTPLKFEEPVEIVFIPAANATGVSGTPSLFVQGTGAVVGISSGLGVS
jgi:hypothetical protein